MLPLAEAAVSLAAPIPGPPVLRIQLDGLGLVGNRLLPLPLHCKGVTAMVPGFPKTRLQLDGFGQANHSLVGIPQPQMSHPQIRPVRLRLGKIGNELLPDREGLPPSRFRLCGRPVA